MLEPHSDVSWFERLYQTTAHVPLFILRMKAEHVHHVPARTGFWNNLQNAVYIAWCKQNGEEEKLTFLFLLALESLKSCCLHVCIVMVATGQEMVKEEKFVTVREISGNFILGQGNWHFEEKSGKIEIVTLIAIKGQKKHFGSNGCKGLL